MPSGNKPDPVEVITCEECGKIKGEGAIGTHWICDDCKVNESQECPCTDDDEL